MTRLLLISTLYPNTGQPRHGIFVETRLRHLLADGDIAATVIAPVPWFPGKASWAPQYAQFAGVVSEEERHGIKVYHPRYLVIPKIGMLLTPLFLAISVFLQVRRLRREGLSYDLVDGHYYYPDGVAISLLARYLGRPFTVTARGTDINLIPEYRLPRRMILWAADRAAASITVCRALKERMVEIGASPEKIHVLRNGVDLEKFRLMDRGSLREKFAMTRTTLLSVGHLIERKGHNHVIDALVDLPDVDLMIAGDGEESEALKQQVSQLGLDERVRFLGALDQQQLAEVYNAVDIMVLASSREGWANVLLESMACGTPVVATSIWGTPEVVAEPAAGVLVEERSGAGLAAGVRALLENYPAHEDTRSYAERFSWDETVAGIKRLFDEVLTPTDTRLKADYGASP